MKIFDDMHDKIENFKTLLLKKSWSQLTTSCWSKPTGAWMIHHERENTKSFLGSHNRLDIRKKCNLEKMLNFLPQMLF